MTDQPPTHLTDWRGQSWTEEKATGRLVGDMLTRLRNANRAYHDQVSLPSSRLEMPRRP